MKVKKQTIKKGKKSLILTTEQIETAKKVLSDTVYKEMKELSDMNFKTKVKVDKRVMKYLYKTHKIKTNIIYDIDFSCFLKVLQPNFCSFFAMRKDCNMNNPFNQLDIKILSLSKRIMTTEVIKKSDSYDYIITLCRDLDVNLSNIKDLNTLSKYLFVRENSKLINLIREKFEVNQTELSEIINSIDNNIHYSQYHLSRFQNAKVKEINQSLLTALKLNIILKQILLLTKVKHFNTKYFRMNLNDKLINEIKSCDTKEEDIINYSSFVFKRCKKEA